MLLSLQCFRPALDNVGAPEGPESLAATLHPPAEVSQFLAASCYDCHSDSTKYPWYAYVQPIGWAIANHVRDGKQALNLSTFGSLHTKAQAQRLEYMAEAIVDREMPLPSYRLFHQQVMLSEKEMASVNEWINHTQKVLDSHLQASEVSSR